MIYFSLKVETVLVCDSFEGIGSYGVFVFVYLCICVFVFAGIGTGSGVFKGC